MAEGIAGEAIGGRRDVRGLGRLERGRGDMFAVHPEARACSFAPGRDKDTFDAHALVSLPFEKRDP